MLFLGNRFARNFIKFDFSMEQFSYWFLCSCRCAAIRSRTYSDTFGRISIPSIRSFGKSFDSASVSPPYPQPMSNILGVRGNFPSENGMFG